MLSKVFRIICTLCGILLGYGVSILVLQWVALDELLVLDTWGEVVVSVCISLLFGIIFFNLYDSLRKTGKRTANEMEGTLLRIPPAELGGSVGGLIIGLVVAFLISQILLGLGSGRQDWLGEFLSIFTIVLSVAIYILFGYVGINTGRKIAKELAKNGFPPIPLAGWSSKSKGKVLSVSPKILDTSVIIDGRIADIMRTGFIEGDIIIPDFVLVELRHIADSSDSLKRQRGRRGLDILNRIETEYGVEIYNTNQEKSLDDIPEVDVKLLKLAEIISGIVVTNDFNLNKVAAIQEIKVLNINELANVLKPVVLPGEDMEVFLVKEGKENGQAIAYLDDGTMIVVEGGKKYIGKSVKVTVNTALQTSAGRMIFAKPKI